MTLSDAVLGFRARERSLGHVARLDLPARPADLSPVTERDLASLPEPAQRYLRFMGVLGRPHDWSFRARFNGRFRMRTRRPWMPFDAWQYNASDPVTRVIDVRIGPARPVDAADTQG